MYFVLVTEASKCDRMTVTQIIQIIIDKIDNVQNGKNKIDNLICTGMLDEYKTVQ